MNREYATLYQQIGRLLEAPPDLSTCDACVRPEAFQWLSKNHALVKAVNVSFDASQFSTAVDHMRTAA